MDVVRETASAAVRGASATSVAVLIIEDDSHIAAAIAARLTAAGYATATVGDGAEGLATACGSEGFDAIILDRLLPTMDGLSLLGSLRARGVRTPVLMLSALDRIADRVDGLDCGADDYLTKPFAFDELLARVGAMVRRRRRDRESHIIEVGELRIDMLNRQVRRAGEQVPSQPREFRLLEVLAKNAGSVVSRMMLLEQVWSYRFDPQTKVLQTHLSRLRAKLNEGGRAELIETVRNVGYRMAHP